MKMNWPACRLTLLVLAGLALIAGPAMARPTPAAQLVRVDAHVSAGAVRIEAQVSGPFEYTTLRPSQNLLVVDLPGVLSTESSTARGLQSELVSSYRVLQFDHGVRLEVLLRSASVEPRFERRRGNELTMIFEVKAAQDPAKLSGSPAGAGSGLIAGVEIGRSGERTNVRVTGNGHLAYHAERLDNPSRLVLDFAGTRLAVHRTSISSDLKPVRGVRLSQFRPEVARVVIDLERTTPYTVREDGKGIVVAFAAVSQPSHSSVSSGTPAQKAIRPATLRDAPLKSASLNLPAMPLPSYLTQRTVALASLTGKDDPPAPPANGTAPVRIQAPQQPTPQATPAATPPTPQASMKYSGEPISVNLKDVDLKDFFRLIHEISGLNVVLDPAVKGSLTIVLDDVPWDQALEIVLKNNNLDKQLDGNVLRIATQDTLKKEAETKRDLVKAQAEAIEQTTATRVLSYAKASTMRETLKRFLSTRGDILADERSNTLIIRDIPSVLPTLDDLIRQLDRKAQQVEIEARVVAASRSFARDIGTQFGFASNMLNGRNTFGGTSGVGISPILHPPTPPLVAAPVPTPTFAQPGGLLPIPLNTNLAASTPTSGLSFSHSSPNVAVDFMISMAESKGVGKLLSKPKVITQNNEKATVKQGTKIPVQTTINNTISVQFIDAVLRLEVTPQITAEGTVFMDVVVENTQIDQGIPRVQGIPALDTQSAETKVLINDGGTVVIGGVIISSQRTDIAQVPLVGSLPLIGNLFKRTTVNVQSQELLFFLTPRIIPG